MLCYYFSNFLTGEYFLAQHILPNTVAATTVNQYMPVIK